MKDWKIGQEKTKEIKQQGTYTVEETQDFIQRFTQPQGITRPPLYMSRNR